MEKFYCIFITFTTFFYATANTFFPTLKHIKPQTTSSIQQKAVYDLIYRIIPDRASEFLVEVNPDLSDDSDKDAFQLEKTIDGIVIVRGTTGVAAATGFNYYLKYYCNNHISWEASQLNLPQILPEVNIKIILNDKFRYYQNVCTTSYSFVWWNWNQWEKHIDWMALNSFNLVLAFNGQEAIWQRVYQKFNLTTDEINQHFAGPAFLSWLRMGNIRGWAGPLSSSWHSRSLALQKLILERMRSLGIIPVLPAFAGHLPRGFKRLYPNVNMTEIGVWNGFNDTYCCPYFLDPTEDLFNEIGQTFLIEQINEYGTDHVYNCDSFNENTPSTGDLTYLANLGKSTYKAMTDVDTDAIWLMQGWLFVHDFIFWTRNRAKALVTSVPKGKMIILDLQSEQFPQYQRLNQYFGQPFIWCMLHNFGGTLGMYGSSTVINEEPISARLAENSTIVGTGLTPEGINQNYVIYDLMTETAWRNQSTDLAEWFSNYTIRRYGVKDDNAIEAWKILQKTVYDFYGIQRIRGKYAITLSPSLRITTWSWYSSTDLEQAWTYLLKAYNVFGEVPGYLHDVVDITRQVLQVKGDYYYNEFTEAFVKKNLTTFQQNAEIFLEIFTDLENILETNEAFLLGRWLEDAKAAASNSEEEELFEYNARNQITLWGPRGEILDYANKQWAGVVSSYFAPRWRMFIEYMNETLINGGSFNQTFIKDKIYTEVEEPFTFDRTIFPSQPIGNTVVVAHDIYNRWISRKEINKPRIARRKGWRRNIRKNYKYFEK